jgi:RNA polymerase-binding transcription factor
MAGKKTKKKNTATKPVKKASVKKASVKKTKESVKAPAKKVSRILKPKKSHIKKTAAKVTTKGSPTPKPLTKESEDERRARLRKLLLDKRREILKEIKIDISKYIKGENRQLVDTALDDGDWSVVDLSEDISLRHLSAHRDDLQRIDEAIRKIDEGTYGLCEDCGEEISEERLKILPYAIYCIDCKESREQIEEMERREGLL